MPWLIRGVAAGFVLSFVLTVVDKLNASPEEPNRQPVQHSSRP